jgi:aspartate ammonia-lyase
MNTNEVLANRAIEILGGARGDYSVVNPNDHVNMAQSTNDTIPAAIRIAARLLQDRLDPALEELAQSLEQKAREFEDLPTSARTHLQDAVPMRLGQQFGGYATTVNRCREKLREAAAHLEELNLGSTAAGTGMNSHPDYAVKVAGELARLTGLPLRRARNFFDVGSSLADMAHYSGALRTLALELTKLANDLRLYSSGPNTGLDELRLPPVQPGSSIMPGKVNPVMAECLNMICFQVLGNDTAVAYAAQAGQFQLNVMMPLVAYNLLHAQKILQAFLPHFSRRCIAGITANPERCRAYFERTLGMATALNPIIGYSRAAQVVQQALREGKSVFQVIEETGLMTAAEIRAKFDPRRLTEPGLLQG